jgi:hypothetical protein
MPPPREMAAHLALEHQEITMKVPPLVVVLAGLTAAVLACSPSSVVSSSLYKEDFGSENSDWCVDSDTTSSSGFEGGEYFFKVQQDNWFVWCNPDQDFEAIHVEVTVKNVTDTTDTVFGLMCHAQFLNQFYYLGITTDGLYTIRLYRGEDDEEILAEDESTAIALNADSYRLGADCGNGTLTLYVDGQEVASTTDDTYTSGDIGLFAWSGDQLPAEIRYDDLVVDKLEVGGTPTP